VLGFNVLTAFGQLATETSRAAIIAFTMPVWAACLSTWLLGERLSSSRALGLACGLAGLAVLIGPDLQALRVGPLGAALMLAAAISWACGTVALKRFRWTVPTAALAGWQLMAGAVPVTAGALILEDLPSPGGLSASVITAIVYSIALPMLFCHWAWFAVVRLFPAVAAAIGTMAIPVVGVFSSALILGEQIGWGELIALTLISAALALVLILPAWPASTSP
jgi:drug/metabolite transporter (DMT)-like permease